MDLSIVIVNWNTRELLRRCLESIYANVPPLSFEVFVVDNASIDGSADMVASKFPSAELIRSEQNLGFSAGNNLAIRKASGSYLLLLNPDAELLPGSVQEMVKFAESNPDIALVGPKLLNTDGSLQKNGRMFPGFVREVLGITRIFRLVRHWYDINMGWGREDFDSPTDVDEISGACILARKSAVDAVGTLDERFFMYYEEVDWCYRMRQGGWRVYYLPSAEVKHHWAQGVIKSGVLDANRILYRSQYLYFRKHHGLLQAIMLRGLSALLLAVLSAKYKVFPPKVKATEGGE